MGDVGKFCVVQGLDAPGLKVKPVALSAPSEEATLRSRWTLRIRKAKTEWPKRSVLSPLLTRVYILSETAQSEIEAEIRGCDSVNCLSWEADSLRRKRGGSPRCHEGGGRHEVSRCGKACQPVLHGNWRRRATNNRMVGLWAVFLSLVIPSAKADLIEMEKIVTESGLDYLLVRAMGLTPEEPPEKL